TLPADDLSFGANYGIWRSCRLLQHPVYGASGPLRIEPTVELRPDYSHRPSSRTAMDHTHIDLFRLPSCLDALGPGMLLGLSIFGPDLAPPQVGASNLKLGIS